MSSLRCINICILDKFYFVKFIKKSLENKTMFSLIFFLKSYFNSLVKLSNKNRKDHLFCS